PEMAHRIRRPTLEPPLRKVPCRPSRLNNTRHSADHLRLRVRKRAELAHALMDKLSGEPRHGCSVVARMPRNRASVGGTARHWNRWSRGRTGIGWYWEH